jgi:hypothetical protein
MPSSNDYVQALRIPVLGCPERVYISGFPGEQGTLRVCFPNRRFLTLDNFRLALARAPGPIDRGRVQIFTSIDEDGTALIVDIAPRQEEDAPPFSIALSPEMVREIDAAFRLAEVIQDHFARFAPTRLSDRQASRSDADTDEHVRPTVRAPELDGSLFFIEEE